MEGIGYGMFHCPRCGTLLNCPVDGAVNVPALVERLRDFIDTAEMGPVAEMLWNKLGIAESINTPENRK